MLAWKQHHHHLPTTHCTMSIMDFKKIAFGIVRIRQHPEGRNNRNKDFPTSGLAMGIFPIMACCSSARILLAILVCLSVLSIPLVGILSVVALAWDGLAGFKVWTTHTIAWIFVHTRTRKSTYSGVCLFLYYMRRRYGLCMAILPFASLQWFTMQKCLKNWKVCRI